MTYALKPKKKYKVYKLYNAKSFLQKPRKKIRNQISKLLNYKDLLTKKKPLILKNNEVNFVKNQKKIFVSYICVTSPN